MSRKAQDCLEKYRAAKKETGSLRQTFLKDKIARKAQNRKVTTENMVKMLKREQRSIQEGVELRQIRGRNNQQPVLKAEITDFITGTTTTMYTQEEIVIAAAESNLRRQSQTVGTAFLDPTQPFLSPLYSMLLVYVMIMKLIVFVSLMARLFLMKMGTLMLFHYWKRLCSRSHPKNEVLSTASSLLSIILTLGTRKKTPHVWCLKF